MKNIYGRNNFIKSYILLFVPIILRQSYNRIVDSNNVADLDVKN